MAGYLYNPVQVPASVPPTRQVASGVGLSGGGDLSANRTLAVNFGNALNTVPQGNDSRFVYSQQVVVPSGGQATVSFTAFPATYQRLRLSIAGRCDAGTHQQLLLRFNGDTGNNYASEEMLVTGANPPTTAGNTANFIGVGFITGTNAAALNASHSNILVSNYAGTLYGKPINAQGWLGSTSNYLTIEAGVWLSASPITSVTFSLASGNFVAGTVASMICE